MSRQLLDAIRQGDGGAVQKLLESDRALVDARGGDGVPAVRLALYYRHPEIAQVLIEHGAALDIHDAAAAGQMDRLRALTTSAAVVNSLSADGATALGLAAFFGHLDAVEYLLDHGARIDMPATNLAFPFAALHWRCPPATNRLWICCSRVGRTSTFARAAG
jgi:ankyrin repeat protein